MSELKTYSFPVDHGDFTATVELFYLKSEADKVIAELTHHRVGAFRFANMGLTLTHIAEKEIDRQKYKRCLDKVEHCKACSVYYFHISGEETDKDKAAEYRHISDWYDKWEERWLELAKKFKEE